MLFASEFLLKPSMEQGSSNPSIPDHAAYQLMVAPMTNIAMAYVMTKLLVVASPTGVVGRPLRTRQESGKPMSTLH